jgi:hypothetical protein
VTGTAGIHIHVNGTSAREIANEGLIRPIRGTTDWKRYEAIAPVGDEAQSIFTGITLNGPGKLWIDEFKVEAVP